MSAEIAVGVLEDGTVHYAPVGEIALDGPRIVCHLCGRSYPGLRRRPDPGRSQPGVDQP
ncbi:MAG TPA: hypothetical protein VFI65_19395 [Streptosporangiaceae bacterium]|nr:hypothetical protein [Streptosporangiaceae bacterium]